MNTLWESICALAGTDGCAKVKLAEAVERSAVPTRVAVVEVRRLIQDGLLAGNEDEIELTERGRKVCFDLSQGSQAKSQNWF